MYEPNVGKGKSLVRILAQNLSEPKICRSLKGVLWSYFRGILGWLGWFSGGHFGYTLGSLGLYLVDQFSSTLEVTLGGILWSLWGYHQGHFGSTIGVTLGALLGSYSKYSRAHFQVTVGVTSGVLWGPFYGPFGLNLRVFLGHFRGTLWVTYVILIDYFTGTQDCLFCQQSLVLCYFLLWLRYYISV